MTAAARRGRRGRRVKPAAIWAAVATAIGLHGVALGSVHVFGLNIIGEGFASNRVARASALAEERELRPGCTSDAVLGSAARYSLCLAPWERDVDGCMQAAATDMWIDLSSCRSPTNADAIASVSMLDRRNTDKVKPIDPEKLIEEARKEAEKPKPPEVPVPQPLQPQIAQQQPTPPPPPPPERPMQVVETANKQDSKDPENARLIAEHSSIAEKQTVARGAVNEPMVAKSQPAELTAKTNPQEASVQKQEPDRPRGANREAPDVPGTLAMRQPGVRSPAEVAQDQRIRGATNGHDGPLAMDGITPKKGDGALEQQHKERSEIARGQGGAGGGAPDVPNLKPTQETLERIAGGGSVDHLDDINEGDETSLNAKGWVHATFFNRLKRTVAQNWDPSSVMRRRDPNGSRFGSKPRITEVRVALTKTGALAKIVVVSSSGLPELDDEAVRAFHAAAPFVNPPGQLVNSDGLIVFAFGFYLEAGQQERTSWSYRRM